MSVHLSVVRLCLCKDRENKTACATDTLHFSLKSWTSFCLSPSHFRVAVTVNPGYVLEAPRQLLAQRRGSDVAVIGRAR